MLRNSLVGMGYYWSCGCRCTGCHFASSRIRWTGLLSQEESSKLRGSLKNGLWYALVVPRYFIALCCRLNISSCHTSWRVHSCSESIFTCVCWIVVHFELMDGLVSWIEMNRIWWCGIGFGRHSCPSLSRVTLQWVSLRVVTGGMKGHTQDDGKIGGQVDIWRDLLPSY